MSDGLATSTPAGNARPVMRTLSQLQQVPVQTLSRMEASVRSFHCPAKKVTDWFQQRGGTGGRSRNGFAFLFPLAFACAFSRRVLQRERDEAKERADPSAALIAALRNSAGASPTMVERGMTGAGFFSVAWVSFSSAVRASWLDSASTPSCV